MSWHFIERWLQKVNQHSTLIGKFWITFLIVFRIVVVSSVGDRVYSDEQSEFKCNTLQVGCANICFNTFSPISHIRFWSFQIIMVCIPSIIFMVYSAHNTKKKNGKEKQTSHNSPMTPEKGRKPDFSNLKNCPSDEDNCKKKNKRKKSQFGNAILPPSPHKKKKHSGDDGKGNFTEHYALYSVSVLLRTLIEIVFILLQYYLFGTRIPSLYRCEGFPCPNKIDCFVSRPMEKTIFLWFMMVIAVISLTLNVAEIVHLFFKWLRKGKSRPRKLKSWENEFVIHDAEYADGGIVPARNPPPDYGRISNGEFAPLPRPDNLKEPPMAVSVSLDDPVLANHIQPSSRLIDVNAPSADGEFYIPNTQTEQSYANLKRPVQRNGKGGKNGTGYHDYV